MFRLLSPTFSFLLPGHVADRITPVAVAGAAAQRPETERVGRSRCQPLNDNPPRLQENSRRLPRLAPVGAHGVARPVVSVMCITPSAFEIFGGAAARGIRPRPYNDIWLLTPPHSL